MNRYHSDWQRRRSDFNHQWLKNRFLPALDTAHNVLTGRIQGRGYLQELADTELPEWPERREGQLHALLRDFPTGASPLSLFEEEPFSWWSESTRRTISALIFELWQARHPVADWLRAVQDAAATVDDCHARLVGVPVSSAGGQVNPAFATGLEEFRVACRALSKTIERLPSRVLLT